MKESYLSFGFGGLDEVDSLVFCLFYSTLDYDCGFSDGNIFWLSFWSFVAISLGFKGLKRLKELGLSLLLKIDFGDTSCGFWKSIYVIR